MTLPVEGCYGLRRAGLLDEGGCVQRERQRVDELRDRCTQLAARGAQRSLLWCACQQRVQAPAQHHTELRAARRAGQGCP